MASRFLFAVVCLLSHWSGVVCLEPVEGPATARRPSEFLKVATDVSKVVVTIRGFKKAEVKSEFGILLKKQGVILASTWVVDKADRLEVFLSNGKTARAAVAFSDTKSRLSFLRIEHDVTKMPEVGVADSNRLRAGDIVMSLEPPSAQPVCWAFVGTRRLKQGEIGFLQLDCGVSAGGGRGPVINRQGELVGFFLTESTERTTANFAVPSNEIIRAIGSGR